MRNLEMTFFSKILDNALIFGNNCKILGDKSEIAQKREHLTFLYIKKSSLFVDSRDLNDVPKFIRKTLCRSFLLRNARLLMHSLSISSTCHFAQNSCNNKAMQITMNDSAEHGAATT